MNDTEKIREHCKKNPSVTITSELAILLLDVYDHNRGWLSMRGYIYQGIGGALVWAAVIVAYLWIFKQ